MMQLFNLAIFTKKEVMQLLIDEKKASYRKGYKAGAALRYRYAAKNPPTSYGDSLPVKEMPEVKVTVNGVPEPIDVAPKVVDTEPSTPYIYFG